MSYSYNFPKNTLKSISKDTTALPPDSVITRITTVDLYPCIDCFLRLEAISKDREECMVANSSLSTKLLFSNQELEYWKRRSKMNTLKFGFLGIGVGAATTLYFLGK